MNHPRDPLEKPWSPAAGAPAADGAEWVLFTDWCAVTGRARLPATPETVNLHGKWPSFCKLSGRYWRLIWPPYRPHALHSNWCLKTRPFSVQRNGQINRQFTQQADTGLAHHKALRVDEFVAAFGSPQKAAVQPAPVALPAWDWAAANQRKKDAVQQLAPLADALDDIENRIAELIVRTKDLELS